MEKAPRTQATTRTSAKAEVTFALMERLVKKANADDMVGTEAMAGAARMRPRLLQCYGSQM